MSSVKTRKLDISTILAVVKAQTGSGSIDSWVLNKTTEDIYNNNNSGKVAINKDTANYTLDVSGNFRSNSIIDNSGKVAINKDTADYTLDVSGNFRSNSIIDKTGSQGVSGQFLSSTGNELEWKSNNFGACVLRETSPLNTTSPISSFVLGAKTLRQLNNIQFNTLGITLSGASAWRFTIPTAGTYIFKARALYDAGRNVSGANPTVLNAKLFINYQNATPSPLAEWISGNSDRSSFLEGTSNMNYFFNYSSELSGIGTVNANAVLSLEHQINTPVGGTAPTVRGGGATNMGSNEIYAELVIQRVA